jgi:hypothetical protein
VQEQDGAGDQPRQGNPVANLLEKATGRSKSRRCHVRATEVIDKASDDNIGDGDPALADEEGLCVVAGVLHL